MKYVILIAAMSLAGCSYHTSDGDRTGIVTKVTSSGLLCKTNEVTMSVGYTKNGVGTVSKEDFHFTIKDPRVLEAAKKYQEQNIPVKVDYHAEILCVCDSEHCYFGDNVRPIQ